MAPLVGRGASGRGRRSGLQKRRLASTALAMSALFAVTTAADADTLLEGRAEAPQERVVRNAHKRPDPVPYRVVLEQFALARHEALEVQAPGEAPDFEWDAVLACRLRHATDIGRAAGPCLGLGVRLGRLTSASEHTFRLFASGLHQSGAPNLASV